MTKPNKKRGGKQEREKGTRRAAREAEAAANATTTITIAVAGSGTEGGQVPLQQVPTAAQFAFRAGGPSFPIGPVRALAPYAVTRNAGQLSMSELQSELEAAQLAARELKKKLEAYDEQDKEYYDKVQQRDQSIDEQEKKQDVSKKIIVALKKQVNEKDQEIQEVRVVNQQLVQDSVINLRDRSRADDTARTHKDRADGLSLELAKLFEDFQRQGRELDKVKEARDELSVDVRALEDDLEIRDDDVYKLQEVIGQQRKTEERMHAMEESLELVYGSPERRSFKDMTPHEMWLTLIDIKNLASAPAVSSAVSSPVLGSHKVRPPQKRNVSLADEMMHAEDARSESTPSDVEEENDEDQTLRDIASELIAEGAAKETHQPTTPQLGASYVDIVKSEEADSETQQPKSPQVGASHVDVINAGSEEHESHLSKVHAPPSTEANTIKPEATTQKDPIPVEATKVVEPVSIDPHMTTSQIVLMPCDHSVVDLITRLPAWVRIVLVLVLAAFMDTLLKERNRWLAANELTRQALISINSGRRMMFGAESGAEWMGRAAFEADKLVGIDRALLG